MSRELLDDADVLSWMTTRPTWRLEDGHLVRDVRTADYPSAVQLLQAQVPTAEGLSHHPVVTVGYNTLRFELWTHDRDGITQLDLDYAEALDDIIANFAGVVLT